MSKKVCPKQPLRVSIYLSDEETYHPKLSQYFDPQRKGYPTCLVLTYKDRYDQRDEIYEGLLEMGNSNMIKSVDRVIDSWERAFLFEQDVDVEGLSELNSLYGSKLIGLSSSKGRMLSLHKDGESLHYPSLKEEVFSSDTIQDDTKKKLLCCPDMI